MSLAEPLRRRAGVGVGARVGAARRRESRAGKLARRAAGALVLGLIFAEVLSFGGSRSDVGLAFAALQMCAPLALLGLDAGFRLPTALGGRMRLALAGFALIEAWAAATLLPLLAPGYDAARQQFGPALSLDPAATATEMAKLAGLAGLFGAGLLVASRGRAAWRTLDMLAVATAAYALWAIGSYLAGSDKLYAAQGGYALLRRLNASFLSPNTAASLFGAMALLFTLATAAILPSPSARSGGWKVSRRARVSSVAYPAAAALSFAALWLTASRGGVLAAGLVLAAAVLILVGRRVLARGLGSARRLGLALAAGAGVFGAAVGLPLLAGGVAAWRFGYAQTTAAERGEAGRLLLHIAEHRPWTGYGLGAFRDALKAQLDGEAFPTLWAFGAAHNIELQWVIEAGAPATLLMFGLVALLLWRLGRRALTHGEAAARARAVLACSAVLILHNQVDFSLQIPAVAALWAFLLGLGLGGPEPVSRRRATPAPG